MTWAGRALFVGTQFSCDYFIPFLFHLIHLPNIHVYSSRPLSDQPIIATVAYPSIRLVLGTRPHVFLSYASSFILIYNIYFASSPPHDATSHRAPPETRIYSLLVVLLVTLYLLSHVLSASSRGIQLIDGKTLSLFLSLLSLK